MNSFSSRNTFTTASSYHIHRVQTKPKSKIKLKARFSDSQVQSTAAVPIQLPVLKSVKIPQYQLTSPSLGLNEEIVVKKLSYWDKDHLKTRKATSDTLYQSLKQFYIKENKPNEQKELEQLNYLLQTRSNMNVLAKTTTTLQSSALQTFVEDTQKEEGAILINTITKTKNRFNISLYGSSSQNGIENDLNIDTNTLKVVQQEKIQAEYYGKVIKEKAQMEEVMKKELMDASVKVYDRKQEKNAKTEEINTAYSVINQLTREYKEQYNALQKLIDSSHDEYNKETKQIQTKSKRRESITKALSKTNEYESKLCILKAGYNKDIEEQNKKVNKLNKEINHLEEQGEYLKYVRDELVKENQIYFKNILKKGYDVRNEGLVWVVKNLLESQSNLEYHDFPKFLSHEEINYLISLASLTLEEQQSAIILNILKKKQKNLKYQSNFRRFSLLDEYIQKKNPTAFTESNNKKTQEDKSLLLLMNRFTAIEQKHREIIRDKAEGNLEDFKVRKIYDEIHNSLIESQYTINKGSSKSLGYSAPNVFDTFFQGSKDTKEFLELILYYRERISLLQSLKTKIKENAMTAFKERLLLNKNRYSNVKSSIQYELIFSALFGSNIQG